MCSVLKDIFLKAVQNMTKKKRMWGRKQGSPGGHISFWLPYFRAHVLDYVYLSFAGISSSRTSLMTSVIYTMVTPMLNAFINKSRSNQLSSSLREWWQSFLSSGSIPTPVLSPWCSEYLMEQPTAIYQKKNESLSLCCQNMVYSAL